MRGAHRPPGPILPGFTGRKPSGISAATGSRPWGLVSCRFPCRLSLGGYRGPPIRRATCDGIPLWVLGEKREQRASLGGAFINERVLSLTSPTAERDVA
jgi:hypothetical protein